VLVAAAETGARSASGLPGRHGFDEPQNLAALRVRAATLFRNARYQEAAQMYREGYQKAIGQGAQVSAVRFLNDAGAALLASFAYREAMKTLLAARALAARIGDREGEGVVALNITSLYLQMGELSGATEEAGRAVKTLLSVPPSPYRAEALAQAAKLKGRGGDLETALQLFNSAIAEADSEGDIALKALVVNQLGYEYLNRERLNEAEQAMSEAFRLRLMLHDPAIGQSYRALALLKMAQGDLKSADVLIARAVGAAESNPGRVPNWAVYHTRGEIRVAQHRLGDAVRDFRTALEIAQRWHVEVTPLEPVRFSAGVALDQIYSSFIRAAGELALETGRESLAREALQAAEENRATGLRRAARRNANWYGHLPAGYGETLAEFRTARVALLRNASRTESERTRKLRRRLAEMEARAGDPVSASAAEDVPDLAAAVSRALDASEALIAFHLDEPHSYVWVVTREGFGFERIEGASGLRRLIASFSGALRGGAPEAVETGERLYAALFAPVSARLESKRHWLLGAEDALFGLPFASLVVGRQSGQPVYLVQRRTLTVVPKTRLVIEARRAGAGDGSRPGTFLGIGDAIYNRADRRASHIPAESTSLQLPRLAGSAGELAACARVWAPESAVLLEGRAATREAVAEALGKGPAVIHFATHFVESADRPARPLIQLSLLANGDPDYLGAEEITALRLRRPGIVVLSGCASGRPEAPAPVYSLLAAPAARVPAREAAKMSLALAWLAAGAHAVVVSLWPTPDDSGSLFQSFYRHFRQGGGRDPAAALARAQTEMIESRTWRSVPRYWAAYSLVVGR
jgi:CHAT domain-containing protein/tetratricopeptide (TPR) repeat protein